MRFLGKALRRQGLTFHEDLSREFARSFETHNLGIVDRKYLQSPER
jgi:hypothetical protein